MPRKKKPDNQGLPENLKPCDECGGLMEKGRLGYVCTSCSNIEWYSDESITLSSMAKCPSCGQSSPNIRACICCGYPIEEKLRKLK